TTRRAPAMTLGTAGPNSEGCPSDDPRSCGGRAAATGASKAGSSIAPTNGNLRDGFISALLVPAAWFIPACSPSVKSGRAAASPDVVRRVTVLLAAIAGSEPDDPAVCELRALPWSDVGPTNGRLRRR